MNIITILIIFTPILLSLRGGGATDLLIQPPLLPPLPPITDLIFADQRLAVVFPIIQNFKNLITSDPFNITSTWTGPDICSYRGFYCENPPDNHSATALASIDFNGFRLTAPTLDGFLDQLPDVALFHANSNNFAGAISPKIASLPYLYELDISNNKFIGAFPAAVLAMPGLTFLDLRFNSFSGKVPPEIFTKELDALFINNNFFVTPFPNNLDSHIIYLTLANNKFFGPIPRTISYSLSSLSEILLMNNLLTGCLPYELGFLREVIVIDIGNNKLTGPLPWSLGCLQNVEILNFAGNLLYGPVPEAVCLLGKVVNVSLSDNYFTHVGPACWRLVKSGVLDVRKNCIRGLPLQRPAAECAAYLVRPRLCLYMHMYRHVPCRLTAAAELAPAPF